MSAADRAMAAAPTPVPAPAHVPRELVRDFNYFTQQPVGGEIHLAWKRLHEGPEIFWTPQDERRYPDSLTVDFRRGVKFHVAFGNGVHRCIGSMLARTGLRVMRRASRISRSGPARSSATKPGRSA